MLMTQFLPAILLLLLFFSRFLAPGNSLSWEATYEAFAHIAVGYLIGVAYYDKELRKPVIIGLTAVSIFELGAGIIHACFTQQ